MIKSEPLRTCIVCGGKYNKKELIRMVFTDGIIHEDAKQTMNGRGRYVCKNDLCLKRMEDGKAVRIAFRLRVISNSDLIDLVNRLKGVMR